MKRLIVVLLLLPVLFAVSAEAKQKAKVKDTPGVDVAAEYIRTLSSVHNIQQTSLEEQQADSDTPTQKMMNSIRDFTKLKLELNASIGMLKGMRLKKKPYDQLLSNTIFIYNEKIKLFDEAIGISKRFMDSTPQPGVDYTKLVARMPEITANIEYLDESLFKSMVMVFALLIDEKPDSEGHMSHLNITKEQKQKLINSIDIAFGESFDGENKNWTVASASLFKAYLQKDFLCTDDWQKQS